MEMMNRRRAHEVYVIRADWRNASVAQLFALAYTMRRPLSELLGVLEREP